MTTPPITSITDELIAELESEAREASFTCCGNYSVGGEYMGSKEMVCCGNPDEDGSMIEVDSVFILDLLAERADLKQQLVAAGITAENCEMFRKDAERYQWLFTVHSQHRAIVCADDKPHTDTAIDAAMNK